MSIRRSSKKPDVSIRPWTLEDAAFVVAVRNDPDHMKWFRQNKPLTISEQIQYMQTHPEYRGFIIEQSGEPKGVCALHRNELCIAAPLAFHADAVNLLSYIQKHMWGEVFATNPALPIYLNCGFEVKSVRERQYYKDGWIDTITIEK